jgi:hypothetical protein
LPACQPQKPDLSTIRLVGCVANLPVSAADQKDAAAEINRLPGNSVIANTIVPDWIRMRDANTACAK